MDFYCHELKKPKPLADFISEQSEDLLQYADCLNRKIRNDERSTASISNTIVCDQNKNKINVLS